MKLEIDVIGNCHLGEVVCAPRHGCKSVSNWAIVAEDDDEGDKRRGLLWLEQKDKLPPQIHINYTGKLLRTNQKLLVQSARSDINITTEYPNTDKHVSPPLMVIGKFAGFLCQEFMTNAPFPGHDVVLVTIEGLVIPFDDLKKEPKVFGLIDPWEFTLADATDIELARGGD